MEVKKLPSIGAIGTVLNTGRDVAILRRKMVLENVRRFDDVVVDADQDQILRAHRLSIRAQLMPGSLGDEQLACVYR